MADRCAFCGSKTRGGRFIRGGRFSLTHCKKHEAHAELLWQLYEVLAATKAVPYRPFDEDPPLRKVRRRSVRGGRS